MPDKEVIGHTNGGYNLGTARHEENLSVEIPVPQFLVRQNRHRIPMGQALEDRKSYPHHIRDALRGQFIPIY